MANVEKNDPATFSTVVSLKNDMENTWQYYDNVIVEDYDNCTDVEMVSYDPDAMNRPIQN